MATVYGGAKGERPQRVTLLTKSCASSQDCVCLQRAAFS